MKTDCVGTIGTYCRLWIIIAKLRVNGNKCMINDYDTDRAGLNAQTIDFQNPNSSHR